MTPRSELIAVAPFASGVKVKVVLTKLASHPKSYDTAVPLVLGVIVKVPLASQDGVIPKSAETASEPSSGVKVSVVPVKAASHPKL